MPQNLPEKNDTDPIGCLFFTAICFLFSGVLILWGWGYAFLFTGLSIVVLALIVGMSNARHTP